MPEGDLQVAPTDRMRPPKPRQVLVPVLSTDEIGRLLTVCSGSAFEDLRDRAILRVFLDTGLRKSEVAGLKAADVNLLEQTLFIRQRKGGRSAYVPIGVRTAKELDRYLKARSRHRYGSLEDLRICVRGGFGSESIYAMVVDRGKRAGIFGLHPHSFRHTFADAWLKAGSAAPP